MNSLKTYACFQINSIHSKDALIVLKWPFKHRILGEPEISSVWLIWSFQKMRNSRLLTVNLRHQTDNHRMSRILFPIGRRRIMSELLWACRIGGSLKGNQERKSFYFQKLCINLAIFLDLLWARSPVVTPSLSIQFEWGNLWKNPNTNWLQLKCDC